MRHAAQRTSENQQLLFLPGVFNETLGLLFEAHQYFEGRGAEEHIAIAPEYRLTYANEMSRITMRLTSAMAWLMVRRAIYAGRMDEKKAAALYRLDGADVCLMNDSAALAALPYYLIHLSEKSLALYERVYRLDSMAYAARD